ncbi:MAG: peptidoglycan bridge formation glycyltransferase FemA/FemB family protein [Chloroflexi bacterium]|nr:peptidoglycan bridge formation glycyltransferase FemA/FemB family protein [Chloroflexota bacterium]
MSAAWSVSSPAQWNDFAAAHPAANLLHAGSWGDLKARYGWRVTRLAVGDVNAPRAGLQVLTRTRRVPPLGPSIGLAYVPRGPLADSDADARALIEAASQDARRLGASLLRVEPVRARHAAVLNALGFRQTDAFVQVPRTAVVDLAADDAELLASFKSKMRYNIRLAARRGVEVARESSEASFHAFYELTTATATRQGFAVHAASYYQDVARTFGDDAGLFVARHDGRALAALLVVAFGPEAVYLYGASSSAQRSRMAPHATQWAAMQWARTRGCRHYDLWGMADPNDPNDPMAGVHRFKLGFNPRLVEYPGTFDLPLQRLRAWALTSGALRARAALQRRRGRPQN